MLGTIIEGTTVKISVCRIIKPTTMTSNYIPLNDIKQPPKRVFNVFCENDLSKSISVYYKYADYNFHTNCCPKRYYINHKKLS